MIQTIVITDTARGISTQLWPRVNRDAAWTGLQFDPTVRAVEEPRVGGHGSHDTTAHLDAGVLTISFSVFASTRAFIDDMARYCRPRSRCMLTVTDDEWDQPRQVTLRFDSSSKPISVGQGRRREIAYTFKAPNALWEAFNLTTASIGAFIPSTTGLTWGTTGITWTNVGITWPSSSSPQPSQVVNSGGEEADWTAFLYGPCTGPKLSNDTVGLKLEFTSDLVLNPGDYVALDSKAQSMLINGNAATPADSYLNYPTSDWWLMQDGLNIIRYYPVSASGGAVALISFRPAWLP